jgi:crotonobetainyl-CoA:carnitine CoA-transferase CaiB-like acyl-CoA transferase
MENTALAGIKVLDLTHHIAGPCATKLLADFGADVLKVERPEGDPARSIGPFFHDLPGPERSGLFLDLNTNKRSITLNLKSSLGAEIAKELASEADIVIESFKPGAMERLGLGYDVLREANPLVVLTSVSNYGQTGPYRDFLGTDMVLYAAGGPMWGNAPIGRYPLRLPASTTQFHAGYMAAVATMIGYYGARYNGIGQHIDYSIFESEAGSVDRRLTGLLRYQYQGIVIERTLMRGQGFPCGVFPCKDGYVNIWGGMQFYPNSVRMMGMPELANDTRFNAREQQANEERRAEFEAEFWYPWVLERTKQEVLDAARKNGVLCGALFTIRDLIENPHSKARNFFVPVDHPETGSIQYPGPIFKMARTPSENWTAAPRLGHHNEDVYCAELGFSKHDLVHMRQAGVV